MSVQLHMLPVKAGDATLILDSDTERRDPFAVLIDTGLDPTETHSYLKSNGIRHLDLVILSHPDADHLGGLLTLMKDPLMRIDKLWCFDLSFLKHLVRTGKLRRPEGETHQITYALLVRSLVAQDEIIRTAPRMGPRPIKLLRVIDSTWATYILRCCTPANAL